MFFNFFEFPEQEEKYLQIIEWGRVKVIYSKEVQAQSHMMADMADMSAHKKKPYFLVKLLATT